MVHLHFITLSRARCHLRPTAGFTQLDDRISKLILYNPAIIELSTFWISSFPMNAGSDRDKTHVDGDVSEADGAVGDEAGVDRVEVGVPLRVGD